MNSVRHTASFELPQSADVLFPLFSPEGERAWVPGWDYTDVMGTPDLEEDYVFLTGSHDHAQGPAVWITKRYEPADYRVEFYKVEPQQKVGLITIMCLPLAAGGTRVEVTYAYRALSSEGARFVDTFTAESYAAFIGEWRDLLEAYFTKDV